MSRFLLYIVGQPGSGKSTVAAALTEGLAAEAVEKPFAHVLWAGQEPVVELGARRESFSGTDALSMSVQPRALAFVRSCPYRVMLAEGDRLANLGFLTGAREAGWEVTVARLGVSEAVASYRRSTRAALLGVPEQSPQWLRGRVSKVRNLVAGWDGPLITLDADQPPAAVRAELAAHAHPVTVALGC